MAALDFPNPPLTVGQTYTAPTGAIYTWDGAVWSSTTPVQNAYWTDTGTALTPTNATKQVVIPGPTAGGTPQAQLVLGTRTMKGRVLSLPGVDWYGLSFNRSYTGAGWVQDDATKPSWNAEFQWAADNFNIERQAPAGANLSLFQVTNDGVTHCTLAGNSVTNAMLATGASIRGASAATIPANWSSTATGTWINLGQTATHNCPSGSSVFIFSLATLYLVGSQGVTYDYYIGYTRDGNPTQYTHTKVGTGGSLGTTIPLPAGYAYYDAPPAGNHYWGLAVLWFGGGTLYTADTTTGIVVYVMA